MRAFIKFLRNKGGSGTLGSDADPSSTEPKPDATNIVRVPTMSSWSASLKRLALVLDGPSDLNFEVWVKEDLIGKWFKATASATLAKGVVTYAVVPAPTNAPTYVNNAVIRGDFVECYIRVTDPGVASNGDYTVGVIGDYAN